MVARVFARLGVIVHQRQAGKVVGMVPGDVRVDSLLKLRPSADTRIARRMPGIFADFDLWIITFLRGNVASPGNTSPGCEGA